MSAVQLIWISIAMLLPSLTAAGTEVCHSPRGRVITDVITKDVEKVEEEKTDGEGFNKYVHPFGEIKVGTTVLNRGALFEDCCNCGDNENAAYQLKIYSKHQDLTIGQKFDKPILVTQGFDANNKTAGQFGFGEFELKLNDVFDENTGDRVSDIGLLRILYDDGYDIALLLWKNPLIDIRTNAKVTLQALRWLESYTDIREGTEPVIIGPSMGGLVTRYALQEAGGTFPENGIRARLFIAFDSPNRGAEIPMSLQALTTYFNDQSETLRQIHANLTSVAARQLLLSSVVSQRVGQPGRFQSFQRIRDYENPTDPENVTARTRNLNGGH